MQRVFIDLGKVPHPARAGLTGEIGPSIAAILGVNLDIGVHFFRNSTQEALAASSTGKLTLKAPGALAGEALFLDSSMTVEGSGAAAVYRFSGLLNSDELIADLGELDSKTYRCSIAWTEPSKTEDKCLDFDLIVHNSGTRPGDSIPANTDARWEWLKDAAPEANGFTHDEETKTLAVDPGGAPDAHAASHGVGGGDPITIAQSQVTNLTTDLAAKVPVTRTINGQALSGNVTLAKADLGLGNVDNTSDANKPISTATQTALNAKEATQTAASQAEAEAGTETAIRKFSPARIKQAIQALAPSGGATVVTPQIIHVASNGNDTTGTGSLAAPFLTAQKAFDAAVALATPCCIDFGVGSFGNVSLTEAALPDLTLRGKGADKTVVGSISGTLSGAVESLFLTGNGRHQITIGAITLTMANGEPGVNAEEPGVSGTAGQSGNGLVMMIRALTANNLLIKPGDGGNGGTGGNGADVIISGNGGDGGAGGVVALTVEDCKITGTIAVPGSIGGNAGAGGSGGGGAGSAGTAGASSNGGTINLVRSEVAGTISAALATGGPGADGAEHGTLNATDSDIVSTTSLQQATLNRTRATGTVDAVNITAAYSTIATLSASTEATTKFCDVATDSSALHTALACVSGGTFFPALPV